MISIKKEKVLITPEMIKPTSKNFSIIGTFNPAAVRLPNGDILLYVRVAEKLIKDSSKDERTYYAPRYIGKKDYKIKIDKFAKEKVQSKDSESIIFKDNTKRLMFISHFRRVILDKTGFKVKFIDPKPSFVGLSNNGELGVEDPRIVKLGDKYAMTYVSLSIQGNLSTSLALSKDGITWNRKGAIFSEQNKDVVLFPETIKDNYFIFNRPEGGFEFTPPHIWMASSKDLINWGRNRPIKLSKKGNWDYKRVGSGAPPIKTSKGWLLIYHGVIDHEIKNPNITSDNRTVTFSTYEVGAALFDLKNPRKLIAKAKSPIISPIKDYEKKGFVNNVIFPSGLVIDTDKKFVLLFSGGADSVTEVKKISLRSIFNSLEKV